MAKTKIGAILWIACLQFFLMQMLVAMAWRTPFHLTSNYISDLGAAACHFYPPHSQSYVCSPWHTAMNISMTLQGFFFIGGVLLWRPATGASTLAGSTVRVLIILAGIGSMLVGLFPEDVTPAAHYAGAALHIVTGNLGIIALAAAADAQWRIFRVCTVAGGIIALAATCALVLGASGSLGVGTVERIAVYPIPLCLTAFGLLTLGYLGRSRVA